MNSSGVEFGSGNLQGKLFSLDVNAKHTHKAKTADQQTEDIWHKRYVHLNHNSLRSLQNNNLVQGLSFKADYEVKATCDACLKGKKSKLFSKRRSEKSDRVIRNNSL